MYFKKSEPIIERNAAPAGYMGAQYVGEAPKTMECKDGNRKVKMLLMTFLIYICLTMLPVFTFSDFANINIYATDITRISKAGMELTSLEEGDLVTKVEEQAEESIENAEDPLEEEFLKSAYGKLIEFAEEIETKLIDVFAELSIVFTGLYAAMIIAIIGFIVMIIASLIDKKVLYLIGNAVVLFVLLALGVAVSKFVGEGVDYIGSGTAFAMLLLIANFFVPFIKRKNKKNLKA